MVSSTRKAEPAAAGPSIGSTSGLRETGSRLRRISLFRDRVWKETLYLLLDLPVGVVGFTLVVTGLSLALGLLITLIGIPLLTGTLLLARWAGYPERARARALLGCELSAPGPLPRQKTLLTRLFAPIRDAAAWRATAYFALMLPVGIVTFTVAVTWWATSLFLFTLPAWAWALPHNGPAIGDGNYWSHPWQLVLSSVVGLLMSLAAPAVIHGASFLDRGVLGLLRRPRSLNEPSVGEMAALDEKQQSCSHGKQACAEGYWAGDADRGPPGVPDPRIR